MMGTFEKCAAVCPEKYKETICAPPAPRQHKAVVDYDVIVSPNLTQIPKIVHQTWFDDITADRYPQLSRLQASWRSSGWDYRYYTDDDARDYIARWYPRPFLESFDALVHGAYKV
jgi:mannosyltransferase OCH1-like enzyme